ncbi:hypothetical protein F6B41_06285 [Microbacterium lushaniae]|nr:hypothetical protein F6B41_24575 [Microbacterium lushaniae]KAA9157250.1 hypothetical protein F6B41_06285 [Microbacterium lushaniae]
MGHLYYGGSFEPIDISDRLLAHVKVVIATKLRRGESFTVSWRHPEQGRSTIWLHPAIELRFVFASPEPEMLDSALLQRFANEAATAAGLVLDLSDASLSSPVPEGR